MSLEQDVVETLNRIRDNLWLGDVQKTKEIITNFLRMNEATHKFLESFRVVSHLFGIASREAKERYNQRKGFEYKLFLSKMFRERIKEPSMINEAIVGLLLYDLVKLSKTLRHIGPLREVYQRPHYRYTLFEYPPKYEIRALVEGKVEYELERLVRNLGEDGFESLKIEEGSYAYVVAFSTRGYIETSVLFPKVSIYISLLNPSKENAQRLGETIVDSLIR
jgi:hypothetical protein